MHVAFENSHLDIVRTLCGWLMRSRSTPCVGIRMDGHRFIGLPYMVIWTW